MHEGRTIKSNNILSNWGRYWTGGWGYGTGGREMGRQRYRDLCRTCDENSCSHFEMRRNGDETAADPVQVQENKEI